MPDRLLFEYRPPRAHPIVYAGFLVFGMVFLTGSLENLLRENRTDIYIVYAMPFLVTLAFYVLMAPSTIRIHEDGVAPARPLILRWYRPFVRWDDLAAVYPGFYDVTGAFVSPFASSDGKVTQMGLTLERPDGRSETVRFTPSRFVAWQGKSRGYAEALDVVRGIFERRGQPLTADAPRFAPEERERMVAEASKPFLPFFAIVFLFASAAPVLWFFTVVLTWPIPVALPLSLIAPAGVSTRSYIQSRKRNRILNLLSKSAEFERVSA